MGPLIFIARLHQIKRKKSALNYRLMQVTNQLQQVAEQMSQANKQKALKQSLFSTVTQIASNSQMNGIMGLINSHLGGINAAKIASKGTQSNLPEKLAQSSIFSLYNNLQNGNCGDLLNMCNTLGDETNLGQLHMIDSQLEQERLSLEAQVQMLGEEEQAVQKQMGQEIKNSAPKFGLN